MHLTSSNDLAPEVRLVITSIAKQLSSLLPRAEFHHIGATAIPGAVTKGDVDVLLRVEASDFLSAVSALRGRFAIKQPENWTEVFASFGDDSSYQFPIGVQLVVKDSEGDIFLFLHDYLTSDPKHLAEYNRVKRESAPNGPEAYWKAKDRYLSSILASRPKRANKALQATAGPAGS